MNEDPKITDTESINIAEGTHTPVNATVIVAVVAVVAVIMVGLVLVPFVDSTTKIITVYGGKNTGDSGINLAYASGDIEDSTVNVTISGNRLVFSGDYSKSITVKDMIVLVSDTCSLYVQNSNLYWFDGQTVTSGKSHTITIANNEVNGVPVNWVYYPETHGEYSSYNSGYEFKLSNAVAVGAFDGLTVVSDNNEIVTSNADGLYAHVQESDNKVTGVRYDGTPNIMGVNE